MIVPGRSVATDETTWPGYQAEMASMMDAMVVQVFVNDDHGLGDSRLKYLCRLDEGLVSEKDGLPYSFRCKPTESISPNDLFDGFT
jgi:hypothetical protein